MTSFQAKTAYSPGAVRWCPTSGACLSEWGGIHIIDTDIVANEFAHLKDDTKVEVNICTVGIPPARTVAASREFASAWVQYTKGEDQDRYSIQRRSLRGLLARLIGGHADEIVLTKNTTEGVCILSGGYPLGPGDNVVTCDLENQSNLFPWFNSARLRGYSVRVAETKRGRVTLADLEPLMDERTKILSLSSVQAGSGYFADMGAIAEMCHSRGVIFAVDAIQALGRVEMNVCDHGIDYLSCGGFKGLLSGFGIGFAWCTAETRSRITPQHVGFMSATPYISPPGVTPDDQGFELVGGVTRLEAGTYNMHGVTCMESSVGMILELGPKVIGNHVLYLERMLRERLAGTSLDVLTPESGDRQSGIVVMYYPKERYEDALSVVEKHDINLTHRPGYFRLAFGIHNTPEDVERISLAMEEVSRL